MSGGSRIVAFGSGEGTETEQPASKAAPLDLSETEMQDDGESWDAGWDAEDDASPRSFAWLLPVIAVLVILGWTGFFGWAHQAEIKAGGTPQQWSDWIVQWSVPTLLVIGTWLLAMRNSRREAVRFTDTAAALRRESEALEARLSIINRELSLAREFLGSQSRELESLGRIASERLSQHAHTLEGLIHDNSAQVETIGSISSVALENMSRLRDDLPVITNSAKDVSNQIGNAGRIAMEQLDTMIAGFERLNSFGEASERQVGSLQSKVEAALAAFEAQAAQLDDIMASRFDTLANKSELFRADLDKREVEALAALRNRAERLREELGGAHEVLETEEEEALRSLQARINAIRESAATVGRAMRESEDKAITDWQAHMERLRSNLTEVLDEVSRIDTMAMESARQRLLDINREAAEVDERLIERNTQFDEQMAERRSQLEEFAAGSSDQLATQLAAIDAALSERREQQVEQTRLLAEHAETITEKLSAMRGEIETVAQTGGEATARLSTALEELASMLNGSRTALDGTDSAIAELTDSAVRLLEIIQAGARTSREDLTLAIGEAETRLGDVVEQAQNTSLLLGETSKKGEQLSSYVIAARAEGAATGQDIEALQARIAETHNAQAARLAELRQSLATLDEESTTLAGKAEGQLAAALDKLQTATRDALANLQGTTGQGIRELAEKVGSEAAEAVDRALRFKTTESIAQLEQAAAHSAGVSREAAVQLRDQLAKVNELASNLETRVQRARERAEEQVNNDFSRRVALITEALNSNSIDIAKALSSEVTDTAWASYLRGDRGIFTRRAVRLIDNTEARDIAEIYDNDPDFRDHVSRYIHDFEAMLRTMLSTRDGNALGVTLLSSDMGKLYVVLAQAIERLREA
ncbi:MAG: ATPase [Sphingomonadaceae bacterium]|nr:ATPase [Sphingomonadaceae bacterium]